MKSKQTSTPLDDTNAKIADELSFYLSDITDLDADYCEEIAYAFVRHAIREGVLPTTLSVGGAR